MSGVGDNLQWCYSVLPRVSRTFALNIRILPTPLRRSVTVAYLLFRAADTIEDTADLSAGPRSVLFAEMCSRLRDDSGAARPAAGGEDEAYAALLGCRMPDGERVLVEGRGRLWAEYVELPAASRRILAKWLIESIDGMTSAPVSPAGRETTGVCGLETYEDLRRYCWHVAGTVGMMLTDLFVDHCPQLGPEGTARLLADAEAFGRGLQLTNILQDTAGDFAEGRCYLPRVWLQEAGVPSDKLLDPQCRPAALSVVRRVAAGALADLEGALRYTRTLPDSEPRLRIFCLWPLFAALRTLGRIVSGRGVLEPGRRPKIARRRLYQDMAAAALMARWNSCLTRYFRAVIRTDFPSSWSPA